MQKLDDLIVKFMTIILNLPNLKEQSRLREWALNQFKNSEKFHHWLIRAYLRQDKLEAAQEVAEHGAENIQDNPEIIWSLALILFNRGAYEKAGDHLLLLVRRSSELRLDKSWVANVHGMMAKTSFYLRDIDTAQNHV